jgi:hypothetical protein
MEIGEDIAAFKAGLQLSDNHVSGFLFANDNVLKTLFRIVRKALSGSEKRQN